MSHFSVSVVTVSDDQAEVARALQPFHEYECTGVKDEFVVEVDVTFKKQSEYQSAPSYLVDGPGGRLLKRYDNFFYRTPTPEESKKIGPYAGTGGGYGMSWASRDWNDGKGYSTRIHEIPEGWTERLDFAKKYMSFTEWVEERKDSWSCQITYKEDGTVDKIVDLTNPNAKWDWYSIGGRWNNLFGGKNTCTVAELLDLSVSTFAVLLPGGAWVSRGDMGWWGSVSNEDTKWEENYKKLMSSLLPTLYVTLVDCHI